MRHFASGWKRNYYGKGDVIAYRLNREGAMPEGQSAIFGAKVLMLLYGDAFWPTYTTGDNTDLIATDSMKNFIQRETLNFAGDDLEEYCRFLGEKFLGIYAQVEGMQITASALPYQELGNSAVSFVPGGPDRAWAQLEMSRGGKLVEARSGIEGFRLLRLRGSAFYGFVRDQYTTLPDIRNRPLHMWLDMDWTYVDGLAVYSAGSVTERVRDVVHATFNGFESGSIQEIIYQIGTKVLSEVPAIDEVNLEANNRTWDTIAETRETAGVYTDARPPFGCLGLSLKR